MKDFEIGDKVYRAWEPEYDRRIGEVVDIEEDVITVSFPETENLIGRIDKYYGNELMKIEDPKQSIDDGEELFQVLIQYADDEGKNVSDLDIEMAPEIADYCSDKLGKTVTAEEIEELIENEIADMEALKDEFENESAEPHRQAVIEKFAKYINLMLDGTSVNWNCGLDAIRDFVYSEDVFFHQFSQAAEEPEYWGLDKNPNFQEPRLRAKVMGHKEVALTPEENAYFWELNDARHMTLAKEVAKILQKEHAAEPKTESDSERHENGEGLDESYKNEDADVNDIVRKELLGVMKGYGWVDLEQLQDYVKDKGVDISDDELLHIADTCLRYTKIYDAEYLKEVNADLEGIENAVGKVIVVGGFKKRIEKSEDAATSGTIVTVGETPIVTCGKGKTPVVAEPTPISPEYKKLKDALKG